MSTPFSPLKNKRMQSFSKWAIALTIVLTNAGTVSAQGYIGKKFAIGFELPMNMGINSQSSFTYKTPDKFGELQDVEIDPEKWYFNARPSINLELILNRKSSIQILYRYFTDVIDVSDFIYQGERYYPNAKSRMNSQGMGLKYRFWRRDGLSPLGKYLSFGVEYIASNVTVQDRQFHSILGKTYSPDTKTNHFGGSFGFGTQYSLSPKTVFNFGIELGLGYSIADNGDALAFNLTADEWAKINSKTSINRAYIINVVMGISLFP